MPRMTGSTRRLDRNTRAHMLSLLVVHGVTNHWVISDGCLAAGGEVTTLIPDRAGAGAGGRLSVSAGSELSLGDNFHKTGRHYPELATAGETDWLGRAGLHGYCLVCLSARLSRDWWEETEESLGPLHCPLPGSSQRVWKQENLLISNKNNKCMHDHTIQSYDVTSKLWHKKFLTRTRETQMSRLCKIMWQDDQASLLRLWAMTAAIVKRSKQIEIN